MFRPLLFHLYFSVFQIFVSFLSVLMQVVRLVFSVTTVKRRPCITAAGTPRTAPSSVSRNTGTPTTNEPAAGRDEQAPPTSDLILHLIGSRPSLHLSVSVYSKHTHISPSCFFARLSELFGSDVVLRGELIFI